MTRLGDIMAKIKNSNGEVGMRMKTEKTPQYSGWLAKVSRVLIFTMLFSTFMHQGWYNPKAAYAVAIGTTTTMVRPTGGTGVAGPLTITNANWSCGAGTNRLLVISVTGEGASGALNSFNVTATKGAGINFTKAVNTTASRTAAYIGYLTEAQITASGTNSIVITAPGVATGFDASVACYSNVDQTNPIYATNIVEGETAALVTTAFSVNALNQGMIVVAFADATAQAINSSTWTAYTAVSNGGTGYQTHALYKAATATGAQGGTFTRTGSARYGIAAACLRPLADFTVGNGTDPASLNVGRSSINNTLDSFTMRMNTGTATVSSLVVTGSANFTSTNVGTNGVKVWRDTGTTVGSWDSGDTQISTASTAIAANATTVTISPVENISTTSQNYIVTVDILVGATLAQAFTGTVTSAAGTGLGTTLAYNDTSSATLTIATPNLAVADGTNPINKTAQRSSINNAADGFTMGTTATSANTTVTSMTVTGSANFTATNIPTNGVKIWRDTGTTVGYWDAGDTLISSASTAIAGNATTVTISSEAATIPVKNYLVTVDITAGATLSQTFTVRVTAAVGANLGTPTYSDSTSATLTVNNLPSASTSCGTCHAYPPYDGTTRDSVSGAFVGDHQKHNVVCSTCHVAPATETSADFAHRDGNITMQATIMSGSYSKVSPIAQVNNPVTGTCSNISCHGGNNPTPQWGVGSVGCIDCHLGSAGSPIAQGLGGPATRLAITPDFSLASSHVRSRGTAVTNNDCCVCHMEGTAADGKINSTYHANGYIELRDPDLGTTIKGVTHNGTTSAPGSYSSTGTDARPLQFSRNLNSAALEADTQAIMVNLCLKCHDTGGATSPLANVPGGSPGKPFAGTIAANPSGNVLDVNAQFASSNRSFHPILARNNNGYTNTSGTRMVAPWNGVTKNGTTTVYGPLMTCWDCHAPNGTGAVTITSSGVHGGTPNSTDAVELRGNVYVNSATATTTALNLCVRCHTGLGTASVHLTGSAWTAGTNGSMTYTDNRCYYCHSSANTAAKPARPTPAEDVHGFSTYPGGGAIAASDGYAFFRRSTLPHNVRQVGATTYTPNCGNGTGICSQNMGGYTPGGVY